MHDSAIKIRNLLRALVDCLVCCVSANLKVNFLDKFYEVFFGPDAPVGIQTGYSSMVAGHTSPYASHSPF